MALPRVCARRVGPVWAARLENPGYLLLPLRLFLGITFCYAGLQKLANPAYLDSSNPASVYAQMRALQGRSPIGPLVSLSAACAHPRRPAHRDRRARRRDRHAARAAQPRRRGRRRAAWR